MNETNLRSAAIGLLVFLAALPAAAEDRYVNDYAAILKAYPKKEYVEPLGLYLSEMAARLAVRTQDEVYRQQAVERFTAALWQLPDPKRWDFHGLRSLCAAAAMLDQQGLLSDAMRAALRPHAAACFEKLLSKGFDFSDCNIRLAEAGAYARLAAIFAGDGAIDGRAVQEQLARYWDRLLETGDLDEDAGNYTPLGQVFLIELAQTLGREDELCRSSGFRRMLQRTRDYISPAGYVPEWGDDYFTTDNASKVDWICVLEYAAWLYDDPTFLEPARRLYGAKGFQSSKPDGWYRGMMLVNMPLLSAAAQPPKDLSQVTLRANRESPRAQIDKLILRTGRTPGDAMILMDLYARGSHAHMEKGPSIAYYEAGGAPLFHNLGRHAVRSAIAGNLFWAMPPKEPFPGVWKPGAWHTMAIPASHLAAGADGRRTVGAEVFLRNFPERNRNAKRLMFDNLRLEGPAGALLVDGFETRDGWDAGLRSDPRVETVDSSDPTQGRCAQQIRWQALSGSATRRFADRKNFAFEPSEYNALKIDLKYEGAKPYTHLRGLGRQVDLGDALLDADIESAVAVQLGGDASGEVVYGRYITADSRLTRRILLLAEGTLIVVDDLEPGKNMDGFSAGQLWQLYAMAARGDDYFVSEDDGAWPLPLPGGPSQATRAMLVRFGGRGKVRCGAETVIVDHHAPNPKGRRADRFTTTFSTQPVAAGRLLRAWQIVVPFDPATIKPDEIAQDIQFSADPDGDLAICWIDPAARRSIAASLSAAGAWQVTRRNR